MTSTRSFLAIGAALAALVTACSSSSKPVSTATSTAPSSTTAAPTTTSVPSSTTTVGPAASPSAAAGAAALAAVGPAMATGLTVSLARSSQGIFLIAPNGHSLYVFDMDSGTHSACTGSCVQVWPALTASGPITAGPAVNKAQLGTANGQVANQVTYYGHLLYFFSGDSAPGQTNGVTIPSWHLLGPFGNVMLPR